MAVAVEAMLGQDRGELGHILQSENQRSSRNQLRL
jgi:hypothetical protein